nr:DUF3078 domain-containing protein [uncultured Flavobacterium sp.]
MRKIALIVLCIFGLINAKAQENPTMIPDSLRHWTLKGNFVVLLSQAAFNNDWQSGGTTSFAGNIGLNYQFNYKNGDWIWENKFMGAYGTTKIKGNDKPTKTDDRLEFTSLLGKKASKYWYYTLFFNFQTQMDSGYDKEFNRLSHFLSPAYFQLGPGMLWKRSEIAKVNFAPATSRLIIVHNEFTEFGPSFGVEQGETVRYEFGASINGYYKFAVMPNVYMENNLNLYSNYLDKPQNIDINYQANLVMKVNQYISTNVTFQAIYDDNAIGAFQIREVLGFGVNCIF